MIMVLTSSEAANQAEIERDERFRSNVKRGIGTAASLAGAGALATGGALASRIMPFLNKYIPVDLAIKGINKVSPRVGAFLKKGQEMGLDVEEGLNFIKEKISPQQEPAKENRNIIQQYSPELHKFISDQVSGGRTPIEAAAIAQHDKRFADVIKKLTKDHKTPWSSIIESIYGSGQNAQPNQSTNQQQQQTQQQPQQGQAGPGQTALMDILNRINKRLGQ